MPEKTAPPLKKGDAYLIFTILVILLVSFIRIRLAGVPLERDEGEYAYMGSLLLQGYLPYDAAYNMKLPGTYLVYALIVLVTGKSAEGIHYGLLVFNAGTMLLLFLAIRSIFNSATAFFTASAYGLMAVNFSVLGFAAHATHFITFFSALGIYFISRFYKQENKYLFAAGICFGLAFLMKQQAVFFVLGGGVLALAPFMRRPVPFRRAGSAALLYGAGALLPYFLTVMVMLLAGNFDRFWFWTVEYAGKYASSATFPAGIENFSRSFSLIWEEFRWIFLLAAAGIPAIFFSGLTRLQKIFAVSFVLSAILSTTPGLLFREHYFIPLLSAAAFMAALAIHFISGIISRLMNPAISRWLAGAAFAVLAIFMLNRQKDYYFRADPGMVSRAMYGLNPFPESVVIAEYLRNNSQPEDRIAILGSEPQIYFLSERMAATGHIYTYGLMEDHEFNIRMQEEMIREIESAGPKYLLYCAIGTSLLRRPSSPSRIFEWYNAYATEHYYLAGIVDITNEQSYYKWGDDVNNYSLQGQNSIFILKRKQWEEK